MHNDYHHSQTSTIITVILKFTGLCAVLNVCLDNEGEAWKSKQRNSRCSIQVQVEAGAVEHSCTG